MLTSPTSNSIARWNQYAEADCQQFQQAVRSPAILGIFGHIWDIYGIKMPTTARGSKMGFLCLKVGALQ